MKPPTLARRTLQKRRRVQTVTKRRSEHLRRAQFTEINASSLNQLRLRGEPTGDLQAVAWELATGGEVVYQTRHAVSAALTATFPAVLSGAVEASLTREELTLETGLVLERRGEMPATGTAFLYSIRAIAPAPFAPSTRLEALLRGVPADFAAHIRIGYLLHEHLYKLDEVRLQGILEAFLAATDVVEVKARRAGADQVTTRVNLRA